ncbi:MAG: replication initiator protein [Arizlama microvirus]|nr:MAG: replication initiator protein [Arizlama microvirus]
MNCTNQFRLTKNVNRVDYPDGLLVPCGKCLQCRIRKRKEWAMRMLHESEEWDNSIFVTLTYDNENRPPFKSLRQEDLTKFLKRLRKRLHNEDQRKIRYFACGEYGDPPELIKVGGKMILTEGYQPHYHLIIFGLSLKEKDKKLVRDSWKLGRIHFGLAEKDSMNYVSSYIHDKLSGELAEKEYTKKNREPVFRRLSMGLGKQFALRNKKQLEQQLHITVNGKKNAIPRYYINLLGIELEKLQEEAYKTECEVVEHYSGHSMSRDEAYHLLTPDEVIKIEDGLKNARLASETTTRNKIDLKKSKL